MSFCSLMCVCLKKLAKIYKAVQASQAKSCIASGITGHHQNAIKVYMPNAFKLYYIALIENVINK